MSFRGRKKREGGDGKADSEGVTKEEKESPERWQQDGNLLDKGVPILC